KPSKDVLRMRHANLFEEQPLLDELIKLLRHTFHLPCGEFTITLEDVSLQIGMIVNGLPSTPHNPTQIQLQQYCRAHILYIIGGELLPIKTSRVHLMYLHLFRDLSRVHRYRWSSVCLANLYREMCRATKPNAKAMDGFDGLPTYPFAKRWGQTQLIFQGVPRGDLMSYRSRLDHMEISDFKWLTYETYNNNLPCEVQQDKKVWNRVRLQFGLIQDLPKPPKNLDALHRVDKRDNQDANWAIKHAQWNEYWSHRRDQVLRGP
ncbi:hypothetical protein Lal_00028428, partial [Lupinus albus]